MARFGTKRVLKLESLESRQLMAGDVAAVFSRGTLFITGDDLDNAVLVTKVGSQVQVVGVPDANFENTIINGEPVDANNFSTLFFSGVKNINFNMNGGNDSVGVSGITLDNLVVKMDDSNDNGNDLVLIGGDFGIEGRTSLNYFLNDGIPGDFIDFGTGNVTVKKSLTVTTGAGDDLVAESALSVGACNVLNTGDGDDDVFFDIFNGRGTSAFSLDIGTGGGNDVVELNQTKATLGRVGTGADSDVVRITDSKFTNLDVKLGAGDDFLTIQAVRATLATFDGGPGDDIYTNLGGNNIRVFRKTSF